VSFHPQLCIPRLSRLTLNRTPLHTAVKTTSDYEVIRLLLKHGANLHHQNRQGRTPLHCYYNTTLQQTIRYCRDDIDNTTQDYLGMTVAHYTAYSKSSTAEDLASCLQDNPNPFAARDSDGRTLLHLALQRGNIALIQYILKHPHAKDALLLCDWDGQTPLHFATASPRTQAIDLVLDAGCDIHATDLNGHTALHHAAAVGNLGAVEKLLERGAMQDLERRNRQGRTPLMAARQRGRREVEDYLRPLCGEEDGGEVEEVLRGEKEVYEAINGSRAFRDHASFQRQFVLLLTGLLVLLVYAVW
jgi:ankyrin repeat protein